MKSFIQHLRENKISSKKFSKEEARRLGDSLGVSWSDVDIDEFLVGLAVEAEHDDGGDLDVVKSEKDLAKIVLAHLKEKPDYYTRLKKVEEDAPVNSVAGGGVAGINEPFRGKMSMMRRSQRKKSL